MLDEELDEMPDDIRSVSADDWLVAVMVNST